MVELGGCALKNSVLFPRLGLLFTRDSIFELLDLHKVPNDIALESETKWWKTMTAAKN